MFRNTQQAYDAGYQAGLVAAQRQQQDPLTLDKIKEMSEEEVIDRKSEVDAVLAGGDQS
jgi:hypothetical protein